MGLIKSIPLTDNDWKRLLLQISVDHPRSVIAISDKMKRVLGFTVRKHLHYDTEANGFRRKYTLYLDFYDEKKKTLFLLRYGHLIQDKIRG